MYGFDFVLCRACGILYLKKSRHPVTGYLEKACSFASLSEGMHRKFSPCPSFCFQLSDSAHADFGFTALNIKS
jgi:hypothetical protein